MYLMGENVFIYSKMYVILIYFSHEDKNASWEAVKLLPNEVLCKDTKFKVNKCKVEVKYACVDKEVENIWGQEPHLVIHVGVHGTAKNIHIEKCASNGFCLKDYDLKSLCEPRICLENSGTCELLETTMDVDAIVNFLNSSHKPIFSASCNVGSYLCGYIYLKSLDKDPSRVVFIHVPPIDEKFSVEETSTGVLKIIEQCLLQLMSS